MTYLTTVAVSACMQLVSLYIAITFAFVAYTLQRRLVCEQTVVMSVDWNHENVKVFLAQMKRMPCSYVMFAHCSCEGDSIFSWY